MSALTHQVMLIVCFVAGKSGGHLLPCVTKAEHMLHAQAASTAYLFSSGSSLDYKIMEKHPDIIHYVPAHIESIPYKQPWLFPWFMLNMTSYFFNSLYKLWTINPAKVISFGGLNSIPVCLASWVLRIPFELYELNVQPGKAIKFLSYFTDTVYICFKQTAQYFSDKKTMLVSYPVRFTDQDRIFDKKQLLQDWNLDADKKTILILGGSQGSVFVNQAIKQCLEQDPDFAKKIQIIHQIGMYDQDNYKEFYNKHGIPAIIFTYNEQLQNFYNLADLIICRAGAGTLFEVEFFAKKCVIIPLQTDLNNHQLDNAQAMVSMYPDRFSCIKQEAYSADLLPIMRQKLFS